MGRHTGRAVQAVALASAVVFLIEVGVDQLLLRGLLNFFEPAADLVSAVLMLVLLIPSGYFLLFRPLLAEALERQRAKEAQRESEERYRELSDSLPEVVFELDQAGRLTSVNSSAFAWFGFRKEDLARGIYAADLLVPEDRARARDSIARVLAGQTALGEEFTALRLDGNTFPVVAYANRVIREGCLVGLSGILVDITEHKRALVALRASEQKFRKLVEEAAEGIVLLDEQCRVVEWNQSDERIMGIKREEALGKPFWDIQFQIIPAEWQTPVTYEGLKAVISEMSRTGQVPQRLYEFDARRTDGTQRVIQVSVFPIKTDKGFMLGGIMLDITERKRAEAALTAESERLDATLKELVRLRKAVESSGDVIFLTDKEGIITFTNGEFSRLYGYSAAEVVGKRTPRILKSGRMGAQDYERFWRAILSKETLKSELINRTKEGMLVTIEGSASPILDEQGDIIGFLAVQRDITARKLMEERLRRAERLELAGQIAGQVAHDFSNLLSPLVGYPELIKLRLPAEHPAVAYCDAMLVVGQQMAAINEDMLTLARRGLLVGQPVEMNRLVTQAVEGMPARPDSLVVELDLDENLPPVNGSAAQLGRVLANLLANAREAMQDVGRLVVRTENVYVDRPFGRYNQVEVGQYVRLEIGDNGPGIADEIKNKIFEPFFTTKQTDRKRGSGLGLAVVQAIVGDHRGYIDLETALGKGTTFSLYLPVSHKAVQATLAGERRGGTESILVVDDDASLREVVGQQLGQLGYRVATAASGEEALQRLQEHSPDLLILDMVMPGGIDGTETYRRALELRPAQRAIIVSGFAESERVREALRLGVSVYLHKPVTLETLASTMRAALES